MYLLTQLSIFDAVQNPKQIRQNEKIFKCRIFFGNGNSSGTSAKNYDRKGFLQFFIFLDKSNEGDRCFGTTFFRKVQLESLMIGEFLRWGNFYWKLESYAFFELFGATRGLKDKSLQKLAESDNTFYFFLKFLVLSDLSKLEIKEKFVVCHDSVLLKFTIIHAKFSVKIR